MCLCVCVCVCVFLSLRITRLGMRLTCLKLIWVFVLLNAGWQRGARLAPNWARGYWRAAFWTCATTPRCDARDRARLGIGHTIGRTSESLSLNLVEVPVCRGIWFLIGGTAKAFSCRRSHETLRKRSRDGGRL